MSNTNKVYFYNETTCMYEKEGTTPDGVTPKNSTPLNPEDVSKNANQVYVFDKENGMPYKWVAKYDYYTKPFYDISTAQMLTPVISDSELTDRTDKSPKGALQPIWDGYAWVEKVYFYNEITCVYEKDGIAHHGVTPNDDDWLYPKNSTPLNPTDVSKSANQIYVFDKKNGVPYKWVAKYDYYTKPFYDISTAQILTPVISDTELTDRTDKNPTGLSYPIWDGSSWVEDDSKVLADLVASKKAELKKSLNTSVYGIFKLNIANTQFTTEHTFNFSKETVEYYNQNSVMINSYSVDELTALGLSGDSIPTISVYGQINNERIGFQITSKTEFNLLMRTFNTHREACNAIYVDKRNEIVNSDLSSLQSLDVSSTIFNVGDTLTHA